MKYKIYLILFLTSLNLSSQDSFEAFSLDDYELIDKLESLLEDSHDKLIKNIPSNLKNEILNLKNKDDYFKSKKESQKWIDENNNLLRNEEIIIKIREFIKKYNLHGDDISEILLESFIDRINKRDVELEDKLLSYVIYWKERSIPECKVSPDGNGELDWIWQLESEERKSGIIHVGLDIKTRRFVCYDRKRGLYFPEGLMLERIRAEIVQNAERASDHIGKGYLEKNVREPQENGKHLPKP